MLDDLFKQKIEFSWVEYLWLNFKILVENKWNWEITNEE